MAFDVLRSAFREKRYLNIELNHRLTGKMTPEEQRLARELVLGVAARRIYLEKVIQFYLHGNSSHTKQDLRVVLLIGTYQILFMPWIPSHAAVFETVGLAKSDKRLYHGSKMVNAVLRKVAENRNNWLNQEQMNFEEQAVFLGFPLWIARLWKAQYGEAKALGSMNAMTNQRGVGIRVNTNKSSLAEVKSALLDSGYIVRDLSYSRAGLYVEQAKELSETRLYQDGKFSIQDESAILVGDLIAPLNRERILDLCAAPGGKSFHLASACPDCAILANDLYPNKVARMRREAKRLGLENCSFSVHDAEAFQPEWTEGFDICLVDAPCSALGLIGRKPEIKFLRKPEDLDDIVEIQRRILSQAARYVKPGGIIVYSTCTLNKKENERQIKWLCDQYAFTPIALNDPLPQERIAQENQSGMITLFPHLDHTNGFFIAVARKDD